MDLICLIAFLRLLQQTAPSLSNTDTLLKPGQVNSPRSFVRSFVRLQHWKLT